MKQRQHTRGSAVIDACCLIDLLVSGLAHEILQATDFTWHLATAVQSEVTFIRQYDRANPGTLVNVSVDLTPHIASGLLSLCQPDDPSEQAAFIHYAQIFRSDGEAMCLALARSRGWVIATDDRKAIHVAHQDGVAVLSCPELVKKWSIATRPDTRLLRHRQVHAKISRITRPCTSVKRLSMPLWRKVNLVWLMPSRCKTVACRS